MLMLDPLNSAGMTDPDVLERCLRARRIHVDLRGPAVEEAHPPERRQSAERCAVSCEEERGGELARFAQITAAKRIDARIPAVKPLASNPAPDPGLAESDLAELVSRNGAELSPRQLTRPLRLDLLTCEVSGSGRSGHLASFYGRAPANHPPMSTFRAGSCAEGAATQQPRRLAASRRFFTSVVGFFWLLSSFVPRRLIQITGTRILISGSTSV